MFSFTMTHANLRGAFFDLLIFFFFLKKFIFTFQCLISKRFWRKNVVPQLTKISSIHLYHHWRLIKTKLKQGAKECVISTLENVSNKKYIQMFLMIHLKSKECTWLTHKKKRKTFMTWLGIPQNEMYVICILQRLISEYAQFSRLFKHFVQ